MRRETRADGQLTKQTTDLDKSINETLNDRAIAIVSTFGHAEEERGYAEDAAAC